MIIGFIPQRAVNRTVNEVLASPRFVNARAKESIKSDGRNFIDEFLKWLGNSIGHLLERLGIHIRISENSFMYNNAYIVFYICIFLVLGIIIFLTVRKFLKNKKSFDSMIRVEQSIDVDTDYRALAISSAEKSNYRDAIRYIFWASILSLDDKKYLKFHKSKTNYQYAVELKKNNFVKVANFKRCAVIFNEVFYGSKEGNEEKFNCCRNLYEEIEGRD